MASLVAIFSVMTVFVGLLGIASPARLVSFIQVWKGQLGVWTGAAIRVLFGVALWRSAPSSQTPGVFQFLGVTSFLSGVALPILGAERVAKLISWWSELPAGFIRAWSAAAIALGLFLLWSSTA
jgi:hypothetical protein